MPFVRYVQARADEWRREGAYRIYISEGIRHLCGFNEGYLDLVDVRSVKTETRSAEEIICDIKDHVARIASG